MFKNFVAMILLFFLNVACKKNEPMPDSKIDFEKKFFITSSFDPHINELVVKLKIDPPVHAYGVGEKVGKPVRLSISPKNGWSADGSPDLPPGIKTHLEGVGETILLKDSVVIRQKVKKGKGPGQAVLYLQLCTDKICDRPRSHEIDF